MGLSAEGRLDMKRSMTWLVGLLLVSASLLMVPPTVWAEEEDDDEDVFEIRAKDLNWWYEGIPLNNNVIVLPVGTMVMYMNVDPLITASGLEGVMPHGVKIMGQGGNVIAQSPLLFQDKTTFKHKFSEPGTYDFQCIVHPFMKGKFLVFDVEQAEHTTKHALAK